MQLQITMVHRRSEVQAFIDAMPLLVSRLRELSIDGSGVVDPTTGERRGGLVVTSGVHGRPGARYRLVTQAVQSDEVIAARAAAVAGDGATPPPLDAVPRRTTSEVELLANDPRSLSLVARVEGPSHHELRLAVHDPDRLGTVEVHSARRFTRSWPIGGTLTIDGTADLAHIRSADASSSAAAVRLRHRRLAGTATLTAIPVDGSSIRLTIDTKVNGRGIARPLVAVGSMLFAGKLRRAVAKGTDEAMAEWRRDRPISGEFEATSIADSLLADLLEVVVPDVATDASGPR